jgi:opacity protein-like surface antigen
VDMKGTSWDLTARPTLPLGERFEVFGVLGYSWYDWKIRASFEGETVSEDDKDGELLYGLGAAWQINDAWALRGEWTMIDVSDANFGMVSAAVSYSFR